MGYSDYLKNLLRPMGLYELDEGYGAAEFNALGAGFDAVCEALERAQAEALIPTAADGGLTGYETILPYTPSYETLDDRRQALMALLRIDGCSFTKAALNNTLSGCGLTAVVEETQAPNTVRVWFPNNRGRPPAYEALQTRIEQILPCHLEIVFDIIYITWTELEGCFSSWTDLENACASWDALERYSE